MLLLSRLTAAFTLGHIVAKIRESIAARASPASCSESGANSRSPTLTRVIVVEPELTDDLHNNGSIV